MSRRSLEELERSLEVGPEGRPLTARELRLLDGVTRAFARGLLAKLPPPGPLPNGFAAMQVFAEKIGVPSILERMPARQTGKR